jgi:Methyltransferase domain
VLSRGDLQKRMKPATSSAESRYLQFGCGCCAPEGWRNFDASPSLRLQRLPVIGSLFAGLLRRALHLPPFPRTAECGDVVIGLPVPEGFFRVVYCSHVLEHLSLDELRRCLRNVHRYLCDGGIFRLVMPDLAILVERYRSSSDPAAAMTFLRDSGLGVGERPRSVRGMLSSMFGHSRHLWLWDFQSISLELRNAGFTDIRRAVRGDSADDLFADVEDEERWTEVLGVECRKAASKPPDDAAPLGEMFTGRS